MHVTACSSQARHRCCLLQTAPRLLPQADDCMAAEPAARPRTAPALNTTQACENTWPEARAAACKAGVRLHSPAFVPKKPTPTSGALACTTILLLTRAGRTPLPARRCRVPLNAEWRRAMVFAKWRLADMHCLLAPQFKHQSSRRYMQPCAAGRGAWAGQLPAACARAAAAGLGWPRCLLALFSCQPDARLVGIPGGFVRDRAAMPSQKTLRIKIKLVSHAAAAADSVQAGASRSAAGEGASLQARIQAPCLLVHAVPGVGAARGHERSTCAAGRGPARTSRAGGMALHGRRHARPCIAQAA